MSKTRTQIALALATLLVAGVASATTYTDNFKGASATLQWTPLGNACLTAGDGSGTIPACTSSFQHGQNYTIPTDEKTAGQGALLLTPPDNDQTGAILSAFPPFPMSAGISITFTTYTFGGDSGGTAHNGADGIVFILTDGTQATPTTTGAEGGSMGYDCSNGNGVYDGIAHGYLGLGIDEFGNFLNTGDNGSVGIYNSRNTANGTTANGDNTYQNNVNGGISAGSGPQYQPERIGLRGAGNTNWAWLQSQNPTYYSGSSNAGKVQYACRHGKYVSGGTGSHHHPYVYTNIPYNYNAIAGGYAVLPDSEPIANNSHSATRNPTPATATADIAWPITYKLTISPGGLLNFAYSYNNGTFNQVLANYDITQDNGPIPASLRFGFSAGTGGSNNTHEITCFLATPLQANASAASNTIPGGKVIAGTQLYLPSYSQNGWWGSLQAIAVLTTGGTLSIASNATWDAKCVLTGGNCDSMGLNGSGNPISVTAQSPSNRTLLTSDALTTNGQSGSTNAVALAWGNLSTAQQSALNVATSNTLDTTPGQNRLTWLTGGRSTEQLYTGCTSTPQATPPCDMRARNYVLGDIINSSPVPVGAPAPGLFPDTFQDKLYPSASNPENGDTAYPTPTAYSAFAASNASRENAVYVGSNDGFVHAFDAGSFNSAGTFNSANNTGTELFGYMPYDVLLDKAANLTNPLYSHDYLVDATPASGDVFYQGAWHTWLVGGVGSTGSEIYALDITNPTAVSASNVIGDWDNSQLTHLGNTVGTPVIARMHNGDWAVIFGSGLASQCTGTCTTPPTEGIYVGLINPDTGVVTFQFLDTSATPTVSSAPGGIAYVTSADLDGDHVADYLYAGDTAGRVWRFDVTNSNPTKWSGASAGPTPFTLFTAGVGTQIQPITTAMKVLAVKTGTETRVMVYFGTGQQIPQSLAAGTQYASGTQTYYGIWDWNMTDWDGKSSVQYASLTAPQTITRSKLLAQSVVTETQSNGTTPGTRTLSTTNTVCWADQTSCSSTPQYGWMFDLPDLGPTSGTNAGQNEQAIYNPAFLGGAIVVNTAIPPTVNAASCNPGTQGGWTMAFNPETGGGLPQDFFPNSSGGFGSGSATISGISLQGVGTPTSLQYGSNSYLITNTATAALVLKQINPQTSSKPSRVSWRELVNP